MQIKQLIEQAKAACMEKGARFTPVREQIFSLLANSNSAIGAYDLLTLLQKSDPKAKPPTVYRALDFLMDQGFVHKVESQNAYVLCSHFAEHHKAQLLICDSCGDIQEIQSPEIDKNLNIAAQAFNFKVLKPTIEAHGICKECQVNE